MNSTKTKIIDLAEILIRTKGYNGFSYKDIAAALGVKNAAIHYHFPKKSDLGLQIIQQTRAEFQQLTTRLDQLDDARAQLLSFAKLYQRSQNRGLVCFMGALGPSFDALPEIMQTALQAASVEVRAWVQGALDRGRTRQELVFSGSSKSRADVIVSALMASLILSKVTGEQILNHVIEQTIGAI